MKAVKFKNFTDTDFTWAYDKVPYTFAAGQEIFLEDFKAVHFAKHLVDREMNKEGMSTNYQPRREELLKNILLEEQVSMAEAIDLGAKKVATKKVEVEEFPDLKKKTKK